LAGERKKEKIVEKWIPLQSSDSSCRKILSSLIKEYSFQRIEDKGSVRHNDPPKNRWILNLSWDRGGTHGYGLSKCGESLFFDSFMDLSRFINKYIDPDI
jgi:hypothetical protein